MNKIISTIFLLLISGFLHAQTGNIIGTVKTSDDRPAEFINLSLKDTGKGVISDSRGNFEMKNIEPGKYILVASLVGMETFEVPVEVKPGQTTHVDEIVLKESSKKLKEIVITSYKTINQSEVAISKVPIRPMDLPQGVASIGKDALEQQQVTRMSDAVKNFNGVYIMGNTGGYQEELAGRGFSFGSSNTFKNGVRFNNTAMPEMSSLEKVEIMKGSSAILFGNVAAGGVINLVTRKPKFESGGEVAMRMGSYDFYKPSVDVYGTLNSKQTAAYRVNMLYEKSRSFRESVHGERFYVNPSLIFKLGKETDLLIEGDYLNDDRTADFGVGAIKYTLIDIPRSRFLGVRWSYYKSEQQNLSATITHHFNDLWQIKSTTSGQLFTSDLFANQRPNGNSQFIQDNGDWIRGLQRTLINEEYYITQLDLTGTFSTGTLQHTLLIGTDADKYLTKNTAFNPLSRYDTVNVFNPGKYKSRNDIPNLTERTLTTSPLRRGGVYLQDLVSITNHFKLLAGARFSYLETFSTVLTYINSTTIDTRQFDHALTPRFGIIYQPIKSISLFASYSNSFSPNTGVDVDGKALPPSYFNQYEGGIKNDLFKGLFSANVTVYRIVNSNLAQTSLANGNTNTNIKELAGEITSKGLEIDLTSKDFRGFSLIGGCSYNDTRYTRSNTYIVGSKLRYNPDFTANASIYYSFSPTKLKVLNGFSAGAGALYIGKRWAGRSTRLTIENDTYRLIPLLAYTNLEASLGYSKDHISLRLKVSNLLNELSYNVHDDNSVNPIAPTQFTGTLTIKF